MIQDFSFVQKLVKSCCNVNVHLIPNEEDTIYSLATSLFRDYPFTNADHTLINSLQIIEKNCIYEIQTMVDTHFSLYFHEQTNQILLVGPYRSNQNVSTEFMQYIRQQRISKTRAQQILNFYQNLPYLSYSQFHQLTVTIVQQLIEISDSIPFKHLNYHAFVKAQSFEEEELQQKIHQLRRVEQRYEISSLLTEAVLQGNLSLAYQIVSMLASHAGDFTRNPNALRNAQNLCIVLNTQLRHAFESLHLPPAILDETSSHIANQIETFTRIEALTQFYSEILRIYCELAQQKHLQNLSPFAGQIIAYLKSHLTDNLTVQEVAELFLMNPDYLSHRFHQEMGISFTTYVNQQRVEQAASLLKSTHLQIKEIASLVGYNNTSYFAKQFMRFKQMTPNVFRKYGEI